MPETQNNEPVHHEHTEHSVHAEHHIHPEHHEAHKPVSNPIRWDIWKIISAVLIVALVVSIVTAGFRSWNFSGKDAVGADALSFINTKLLQGQTTAELKEISEESGLYLMKIVLNGKEMDTYVTKDGALFFPNVIAIADLGNAAAGEAPTPVDLPKSDTPKVELFIMSHCPYGTQAEKGLLPVASLLKGKIDFEIKYVSYAMHGQKELDEQMNQVCIKNEQADKFNAYLTCFLEDGNGARCLNASKIDTVKLAKCVGELDKLYKVTEGFNDKSTWLSGSYPLFNVNKEDSVKYGVQGSPTLVINGQQANSDRSPAAYLKTICAAFNTAPEECAKELSAESYSPGFGYTISKDASGAATCG